MLVEFKQTYKIKLELTLKEATILKGLVQNPHEDEDLAMQEFKNSLFNGLPSFETMFALSPEDN